MTEKIVTPKPVTTDDGMGTSYLRMTKMSAKESENTLAKVEHQGKDVFLQLIVYDEYDVDIKPENAHIHENIGAVFRTNEIAPNRSKFFINTDVTMEDVPAASEAKLHLRSSGKIKEEKLKELLKNETYLLHDGVVEVLNTKEKTIQFEVVDIDPQRPTAKVTHNTDIEFIDISEKEEIIEETSGSSSKSSDGEMDVEINVTPTTPSKSFDEDVAGMDTIKKEAQRILTLFDPDKKKVIEDRYGEQFVDRGNGMLLYGPPGCGKTLVSEAIANEIKEELNQEYGDVRFIKMKASQLESRYPGESERRIEYVFNEAREYAEDGFVVLFFDEIETLLPDRGGDNLKRHERQLTNAFLQEMNEVSDDLLVMGATNFPNKIDPAADRRFPMKVFTPPPDEEVMEEVWAKNLPETADISRADIKALAEESTEFTPAEIVDEVLGGELQRELVLSVANGDPIDLNIEYLMSKLNDKEPESIDKYIESIWGENLDGYTELKEYVNEQIQKKGTPED